MVIKNIDIVHNVKYRRNERIMEGSEVNRISILALAYLGAFASLQIGALVHMSAGAQPTLAMLWYALPGGFITLVLLAGLIDLETLSKLEVGREGYWKELDAIEELRQQEAALAHQREIWKSMDTLERIGFVGLRLIGNLFQYGIRGSSHEPRPLNSTRS